MNHIISANKAVGLKKRVETNIRNVFLCETG